MIYPFARLRGLNSITALPAVGQKDTPLTDPSSTPSIPALPEIAEKKYYFRAQQSVPLQLPCALLFQLTVALLEAGAFLLTVRETPALLCTVAQPCFIEQSVFAQKLRSEV